LIFKKTLLTKNEIVVIIGVGAISGSGQHISRSWKQKEPSLHCF